MKYVVQMMLVSMMFVGTARAQDRLEAVVGSRVPCAEGAAIDFACERVDLLSFLPIAMIGGSTVDVGGVQRPVTLNDIWGWTDPESGREYALVGRSDGTAFVDVSDPVNPEFIGFLPSHEILMDERSNAGVGTEQVERASKGVLHEDKGVSSWRDVKVLRDHALVVADASPDHGIQVFDLTRLRDVVGPPARFSETAHYAGIGSAHNIAVNEATGFAYAVGSSGGTGDACGGGLHMVDFRVPTDPTFAGCFADRSTGLRRTGYTHDVQCVVYRGPDAEYHGREICIGSNETAISIADVTDKTDPAPISTSSYEGAAYIHQGWLTEDQRYFLQDDELDEAQLGGAETRTRTMVWDLVDLDNPRLINVYEGRTTSIDHNLYVVGDLVYQANYKSGLRVLDISDVSAIEEVAFFDTYPAADDRGYDGAWSTYPFFRSGVVVVSSIREGLFVLDPFGMAGEGPGYSASMRVGSPYPNPFRDMSTFELRLEQETPVSIEIFDLLGRRVRVVRDGAMSRGVHLVRFFGQDLPAGTYIIRVATPSGRQTRLVTHVG